MGWDIVCLGREVRRRDDKYDRNKNWNPGGVGGGGARPVA